MSYVPVYIYLHALYAYVYFRRPRLRRLKLKIDDPLDAFAVHCHVESTSAHLSRLPTRPVGRGWPRLAATLKELLGAAPALASGILWRWWGLQCSHTRGAVLAEPW